MIDLANRPGRYAQRPPRGAGLPPWSG